MSRKDVQLYRYNFNITHFRSRVSMKTAIFYASQLLVIQPWQIFDNTVHWHRIKKKQIARETNHRRLSIDRINYVDLFYANR